MNKIPIVFERVIKKSPYKVWWGEPIIHLGAHIGIVEDEERSAICWGCVYSPQGMRTPGKYVCPRNSPCLVGVYVRKFRFI